MEQFEISSMVSRNETMRDEDQRIQFGLTRTRLLKGLMHYVQDFDRTDDPMIPSIITFDEINKAIDNNWSRIIFIPLSTANMTVATPLKFEKEKNWTNMISSFEYFLRVIPGSTRIPLAYVIMEDTISIPTEYDTFQDETVVKTQLTGTIFHAGSVALYHHLISLIAGGPAENTRLFAYPCKYDQSPLLFANSFGGRDEAKRKNRLLTTPPPPQN